MTARLGEILVLEGVLSPDQIQQLLDHQATRARPIGLLAEELFGVEPGVIERAWAQQYTQLSPGIDLTTQSFEPAALKAIQRRQAWQFGILPIRFDGPELIVATTSANLVRALRFLCRSVSVPCQLVIAEADALCAAIAEYFPLPGLDASSITERMLLPASLRDS